jgi:hypothetical protein
MTAATTSTPVMKAVIYDNRCFGFVVARGKSGFETFNIDDRSLGIFANEKSAIAALFDDRESERA